MQQLVENEEPDEPADEYGQMPGSSEQVAVRTRGPDREPRTRTTFRDAEAGQENSPDWTRFDIVVSLKT